MNQNTLISGMFNHVQLKRIWKYYRNYCFEKFAAGEHIPSFLEFYITGVANDELPAIRAVYTYMDHLKIGYPPPPNKRMNR
jgi:hypothetical protein